MQKHFRIFENYRNLSELIFTRLSDKLLEMETEKTDLKQKNTNFKILITSKKNDCLKLKIGKWSSKTQRPVIIKDVNSNEGIYAKSDEST